MALAFTDHFLRSPGPMPDALAADVEVHFPPEDYIELALGLGLFHGFSKMLITLGLEPDEMDTTVLPTPGPSESAPPPPDFDDPVIALLADRPDLAARWQHMAQCLDALPSVDTWVLQAASARIATLLGVGDLAATAAIPDTDDDRAVGESVIEIAELFVIDVRAIDAGHLTRLRDRVGDAGLVATIMALAVYDGIWRVAACRNRTAA